MIPLKNHASAGRAATEVRKLAHSTTSVSVHGRDGAEIRTGYLDWVDRTEPLLGNHFDDEFVDSLLRTRFFWEFRVANDSDPRLAGEIFAELRRCERNLMKLADDLDAIDRRWRTDTSLINVVLDTNIFLSEQSPPETHPWTAFLQSEARLVVPIAVLYELDRHKRNNVTKKRAQQSIKWLIASLHKHPSQRKKIEGQVGVTIEVLVHEGPFDVDADGSIIRAASWLANAADSEVQLLSRDFNMCVRARAEGLDARHWQDE